MDSDQARHRAEALFKKEQQAREGQQAMAEYQAKLPSRPLMPVSQTSTSLCARIRVPPPAETGRKGNLLHLN